MYSVLTSQGTFPGTVPQVSTSGTSPGTAPGAEYPRDIPGSPPTVSKETVSVGHRATWYSICPGPDSAVVGLDGREWLAFEFPLHLANLLRCTKAAIAVVLGAGLRGHLGQVEEVHWRFLEQLNRFLASYTCFHSNQD